MKNTDAQVMRPDNTRQRNIRIEIGQDARNYITGQQRVTMVPLTIRRKQNHKVMMPPPGEHSALGSGGEDVSMIRALGKAFYWKKLLDQGEFATIRDLSRAMKFEHGWVAEVLRMTTLAPDIIEAILEGKQPRHLNLQTLRGRHALLPRDWEEQRKLFGFAV